MDVDFTFLCNLIFSNDIKIRERLVQERGHVIRFLQNFRVDVIIYELQKFLKDSLNVFNCFQICINRGHFSHELLFLFLISPEKINDFIIIKILLFELKFNFSLLIFQLFSQFSKSLVDIFHLLELKPVKFIFDLLNKFLIFFIESVRIYKHFLKIKNILLQTASHFLYLHQVMPIMLIKHTFHTNRTRTLLTKILNTLALMPWTRNEISMILELRIIPPQQSQ